MFLLLHVEDRALARRYLRDICDHVNPADVSPDTFARQVAFTAPGLAALGLPPSVCSTFSREFLEGMDDEVRAQSLGDQGNNAPAAWTWGRTYASTQDPAVQAREVHVLVMLYARDAPALADRLDQERAALGGGFTVVAKDTYSRGDNKEHFGWVDGLSMPVIEGVPHRDGAPKKHQQSWTTAIRPGEFVLGYHNEYGCFTESPTAALADDPRDELPVTPEGTHKDLGRNGTYLVYREMTQDVPAFWNYLAASSREPGSDAGARAIALGAKMVGRWPGGAPLSTSPERDDPAHAQDNEFHFTKDRAGLRCPLGAHIRRANPRDVLAADRDRADSIVMVRKHQMIRRGRPFGPPIVDSMEPHAIVAAAKTEADRPHPVRRGLHFICLVGHISRQFEFVQRAWLHSANFAGLFRDGDPISAARRTGDNQNDEFTCQATPLRRKYKAMPQFTTLVGGAYFFLPGLRALRFIARYSGGS